MSTSFYYRTKAILQRPLMKSFLGFYVARVLYRMRYHAVKSHFRKVLLIKSECYDVRKTSSKYKNFNVLLPLIETAHYKGIQLLLIAKALELRGANVKVLICGQRLDACEIRSVTNEKSPDPCWQCKFNEQNFLPLFNLAIATLSDYSPRTGFTKELARDREQELQAPLKIKLDQCVEDSVIRHYYGNVPSDASAVDQVRATHQRTANLTWQVAQRVHREFKPNLVLGYMVAYSEWEPYYIYYNSVNIPFRLVSSTQFNANAQIFHWPALYHSKARFESYLATRATSNLTEQERAVLKHFLVKRKQGVDPVLSDLKIAKGQKIENLANHGIEIDPNKRNIFIFPSVHWDVGIGGLVNLYRDVVDWVISTVKLVSGDKGCHLYIRCHPAEELDRASGSKGIEGFLREAFPVLPPNITVIGSSNPVPSYVLFPYIDLGVVSIGTIGLEMLLDHIPVAVVGKAPYSILRGVSTPNNIDEYRDILLGKTGGFDIADEEIETFAYFYFIKTSIPWNLTKSSYIADIFAPFQFESLEDLLPGKDPYLDHLCDCLVDSRVSPETW